MKRIFQTKNKFDILNQVKFIKDGLLREGQIVHKVFDRKWLYTVRVKILNDPAKYIEVSEDELTRVP